MVYIFSLESYRRNQNGVGHFLHTAKSFSFNYILILALLT